MRSYQNLKEVKPVGKFAIFIKVEYLTGLFNCLRTMSEIGMRCRS